MSRIFFFSYEGHMKNQVTVSFAWDTYHYVTIGKKKKSRELTSDYVIKNVKYFLLLIRESHEKSGDNLICVGYILRHHNKKEKVT